MSPKEYAKILYEVSENKTDKQQAGILNRLKSVLIKNKDTRLADAIISEFEKIQKQKNYEEITHIASASPIEEAGKEELKKIFGKSAFYQNPDLLGGIAARKNDKIYNATLRKKIESLKSSI